MKFKKYSKDSYQVLRYRNNPEYGYSSVYHNLKTIRLDLGFQYPLPPNRAEFYDVSLGTYCSANCPFCYTNATTDGTNFSNIIELWHLFLSQIENPNEKPYQIAIGSTGEPTEHPLLPAFLKAVYETGVVPNYTTNGVILSLHKKTKDKQKQAYIDSLLEATRLYTGGVAVSYSHPHLLKQAERAVEVLFEEGDTNVNLHHIISDIESVDALFEAIYKFKDKIHYHVVLPLMPSGRSKEAMKAEAFYYLEERINKEGIDNIAFGANFHSFLQNSTLDVYKYPKELYSKNMLLQNDKVVITPNSFDLTPIHTIEYNVTTS